MHQTLDLLREIPEYAGAMDEVEMGLKAVCGSEKRKAGKVFVDMTGGTGGSKKPSRTSKGGGRHRRRYA